MVNTFLLTSSSFDPDFTKSARMLDYKRLGKQRVEAFQILNILCDLDYIATTFNFSIITQVSDDETRMNATTQARMYLERCQWVKDTRRKFLFLTQRSVYCDIDGQYHIDPKSTANMRKVSLGFSSHPAVRMWVGYTHALKAYINAHILTWIDRGYHNTMKTYDVSPTFIQPWWRIQAHSPVLLSHLFSLRRKDPSEYSKIIVPDEMEKVWKDQGYCWPPNLSENDICIIIQS